MNTLAILNNHSPAIRASFISDLKKNYSFRLKNDKLKRYGIRYLCSHNNTLLISATNNAKVILLNLISGIIRSHSHHHSTVREIQVRNNDIITSSWDRTVKISDFTNLNIKMSFTNKMMGRTPGCNISECGKFIYCFSYDSDINHSSVNAVRKWSVNSGRLVRAFTDTGEHTGGLRSGGCFAIKGKLYVGSDSGYISIFNEHTGEIIKKILINSKIRGMCFLKDYNLMLCGGLTGSINIFDLASEKIVKKIKAHGYDLSYICQCPFNPKYIITAAFDGKVKIWEMPGFRFLNCLNVSRYDIWSATFYKKRLVCGDTNSTIKVYDLNDIHNIREIGIIDFFGDNYFMQLNKEYASEGNINKFFTNDTSLVEVYRDDDSKITGKEAEYLIAQNNSIEVLHELFGSDKDFNKLLEKQQTMTPLLTA